VSEQKKELWRELCEQAALEQDPEKLHELVKEIIRALDARDQQAQQYSSSIDSRTQTAGQLGSTRQQ
jgi:predicted Zn-dependent protease